MRGKAFHNFIVDEVRRKLGWLCWHSLTEFPLDLPGGGKNYVDILARKDGRRFAVEIETTTRNLISNIEKASKSIIPLMVILPDRRTLRRAEERFKRHQLPPRSPPVVFLLISHITPGNIELLFK